MRPLPGSPPEQLWITTSSCSIFLVHGHDEGARESVARFLEKIGLNPIILHERPDKGVACSLIWGMRRSDSPFFAMALLILLIYPWDKRFSENYNYIEHSIAEEWGIDYGLAMRGFWLSADDSRWTEGADGMALINFMQGEIEHRRITVSTHVLHIAHDITVLGDFNRYSVFTGIDDDPVVYDVSPMDVGWIAGSRVSRAWDLPRLLAAPRDYILDQTNSLRTIPAGYDLVFVRGRLRLYRRKSLL